MVNFVPPLKDYHLVKELNMLIIVVLSNVPEYKSSEKYLLFKSKLLLDGWFQILHDVTVDAGKWIPEGILAGFYQSGRTKLEVFISYTG